MACLLKYENRRYTISTKETSDQCVVFEKGSSLPPLKGLVIKTPQLHIPLSRDIFDMLSDKNTYKVDIRKTLKIDNTREIIKFEAETVSFPFVCKKHFSKKYFTEYVNPSSTSNFVRCMRLVSTPDNKNETLEVIVDTFNLPKKIKGHKVIKLGEEIIVSAKTVVCDVSKFETKNDSPSQPVCPTSRITKRKFEVPYPIKLAAGVVAFFGVLEVGSALISKVVNKIK